MGERRNLKFKNVVFVQGKLAETEMIEVLVKENDVSTSEVLSIYPTEFVKSKSCSPRET